MDSGIPWQRKDRIMISVYKYIFQYLVKGVFEFWRQKWVREVKLLEYWQACKNVDNAENLDENSPNSGKKGNKKGWNNVRFIVWNMFTSVII